MVEAAHATVASRTERFPEGERLTTLARERAGQRLRIYESCRPMP